VQWSTWDCAVPASAWGPRAAAGTRYAVAPISTLHAEFPHRAAPVRVTVRDGAGVLDVAGIERAAGAAE